jgi:hypothetical protein
MRQVINPQLQFGEVDIGWEFRGQFTLFVRS